MATRYAFSLDLDRCIGCQACVVACQAGNELPAGDRFIVVSDIVRGQAPDFWGSFAHQRCFHCGEAPCVAVCPTGTLSKWNGLTVVEPEKCSACGYCTDACPFDVPHIIQNGVSKCTACLGLRGQVVPVPDTQVAQTLKDGHIPWCVQTCPSQALRFGDRETLLTEAKGRVAALQARYPKAQVYGETQLGGLGLLMVLLDEPSVYSLPADPKPPLAQTLWQEAVQPVSLGLSALAAGLMGAMFFVARRQHALEKAELHAAAADAPAAAPPPAAETVEGKHD